jgi:hypothetical protein
MVSDAMVNAKNNSVTPPLTTTPTATQPAMHDDCLLWLEQGGKPSSKKGKVSRGTLNFFTNNRHVA